MQLQILGLVLAMSFPVVSVAANAGDNDCASIVQEDLLKCNFDKYRAEDAALNAAFKVVKSSLSPEKAKAVVKVQRSWISFKDSYCGSFAEEGREGEINKLICLTTISQDRIVELQRLRGEFDDGGMIRFLRVMDKFGEDRANVLKNLRGIYTKESFGWDDYVRLHCEQVEPSGLEERNFCIARTNFLRGF